MESEKVIVPNCYQYGEFGGPLVQIKCVYEDGSEISIGRSMVEIGNTKQPICESCRPIVGDELARRCAAAKGI